MRYDTSLAVQPNCLKGWVVCVNVYGVMHLKDLLGSFVRVGYRIPVPDLYIVLHGLRCQKSTVMDLTKPIFYERVPLIASCGPVAALSLSGIVHSGIRPQLIFNTFIIIIAL